MSVHYFVNLRVECYFSKLGYNKFSFPKKMKCQYNLPKNKYILFYFYFYLYKENMLEILACM